MLTDLSYYKFFYYWMTLNKDESQNSKDKNKLMKLSVSLLHELLQNEKFNAKGFNLQLDTRAYAFKYTPFKNEGAEYREMVKQKIVQCREEELNELFGP